MRYKLKVWFLINIIYLLPYIVISLGRIGTGDDYWWVHGEGTFIWLVGLAALPGVLFRIFFLQYISTGVLSIWTVFVLLKDIRTGNVCVKDVIWLVSLATASFIGLWSVESVFWGWVSCFG